MQDLGVGVPDVELESSPPRGNNHAFVVFPVCGLLKLGCVFSLGETTSASPTCLKVVLLPFVVETLFIQFLAAFQGELFRMYL